MAGTLASTSIRCGYLFQEISRAQDAHPSAEEGCGAPILLGSVKRCPDQYVGDIGVYEGQTGFLPGQRDASGDACFPRRKNVEKFLRQEGAETTRRRVILILESPHKDEYAEAGRPRPANGKTGENIRDHLVGVLIGRNLLQFKQRYALILMNAVRFPCSLGVKPKCYRNAVFRSMWNHQVVRHDFERRLGSYWRQGEHDIIVNACTLGEETSTRKALRRLVEGCDNGSNVSGVKKVRTEGSHLRVSHPCDWRITFWP